MEKIILVNKNDEQIGIGEKMDVHKQGSLHRAFSIFIFNNKGEMMLQKRAASKYHSPGLWTNTCCSHPHPGETVINAAKRRLKQEMGFKCELREIYSFIYKANVGNLIEHEFDHVFTGKFEGKPELNKEEAEDWKWITLKELEKDIKKCSEKYTFWFKAILNKTFFKYD